MGDIENIAPVGQPKKKGRPRKEDRPRPPISARAKNTRKLSMLVSEAKLQEMFTAYCKQPNYNYVGRVCGVDARTVARYAREDEWETRRQKIFASARANADYTIQKATEHSLNMVITMKVKIEQKINSLQESDLDTKNLVADLDKIVKLEQVLMGGASDRTETVNMSHEERIRKIRESHVKALGS